MPVVEFAARTAVDDSGHLLDRRRSRRACRDLDQTKIRPGPARLLQKTSDNKGDMILSAILPYGPTAARKHGRPGRETRPRSPTIDIHSHVSVPAAAAVVAPHLDVATIPLAFFSTANTKQVNTKQEFDRASRITGRDQGLC